MEQLKLNFKGHPLVDPSFKKYKVVLFKGRFDKIGTWVFGIWAKNPKQVVVKAAKQVRMKKYSIEDSLAKIQKP